MGSLESRRALLLLIVNSLELHAALPLGGLSEILSPLHLGRSVVRLRFERLQRLPLETVVLPCLLLLDSIGFQIGYQQTLLLLKRSTCQGRLHG